MSKTALTSSLEKPVLILNPGGQYAKRLDTKVREMGYATDFIPMSGCKLTIQQIHDRYSAVMIAGSGSSVNDKSAPKLPFNIKNIQIPVLGICYGAQRINKDSGGKVESVGVREDGPDDVRVDTQSPLFAGLDTIQRVLLTHGDSLTHLAPGFEQIATSSRGIVAGTGNDPRKIYTVQFHPESDDTVNGDAMIGNFLHNIAQITNDATLDNKKQRAIEKIREKVGKRKVLAYASGGVDSTVLVSLLRAALPPEQIKVVHIDHGFMRAGERAEVEAAFAAMGVELEVFDAKEEFAHATTFINGKETPPLSQVTDPEIKRKIIGDAFISMKAKIEEKLSLDPDDTVLAQGTLWTDIVESREGIKTHHNDTQLVKDLRAKGQVIEPLDQFHKPEVRKLGEDLGVPPSMVWRHPFPGPGLAIRVLCSNGVMNILQGEQFARVQRKFQDVIKEIQPTLPQGTEVMLTPVRSTGVQGDARSYKYMCIIRAPKGSRDIINYEAISKRITDALSIPLLDVQGNQVYQTIKENKQENKFISWFKKYILRKEIEKKIPLSDGVNRVVIDLDGDEAEQGDPALTETYIGDESMDQLRQADKIVNDILLKHGLMKKVAQVPVVLLPLHFGEKSNNRTIVIRTLITKDFLTGTVATPGGDMTWEILDEMRREIAKVPGISHVLYDVTGKPPATTEYE